MCEFARCGLAVLPVVLLVIANVSGPASVTPGFQNCDVSDSTVSAFIDSLINSSGDGRQFNPTDSTLDLGGTQDKVELYSAASAKKTSFDSYNTAMGSYLNDVGSVAWMKAQVAVVEAYEDGKTKGQACIDARRAIADYYAVKQKSDIARRDATVSVAEVSIEERSESELINNSTFVTKDDFAQVDSGSGWSVSETYEGLNASSVTLVNDSSADMLAYNYTIRDGYNSANTYEIYYMTSIRHEWLQIDGNFGWGSCGWEIAVPNSNYDSVTFIERQSFADRWARYETKNDGLQAKAPNFVNATYDDLTVGNINSSDAISANTAIFEYGTQSGSDSTSLYDSMAALTLMGFDVPDMQSSELMNVTDQSGTASATYQGLVLARSTPNGLWSTNATYNASAIDGPVFIAIATGEKVDLDGTFTVTEITARDGPSVQSQNTTQYVYKVTNTSESVNMTNELESLRQGIGEREQSSGGSGGSDGLDSQAFGIALLTGVAAVLPIQREGNE